MKSSLPHTSHQATVLQRLTSKNCAGPYRFLTLLNTETVVQATTRWVREATAFAPMIGMLVARRCEWARRPLGGSITGGPLTAWCLPGTSQLSSHWQWPLQSIGSLCS